jgi:hypothetical protein
VPAPICICRRKAARARGLGRLVTLTGLGLLLFAASAQASYQSTVVADAPNNYWRLNEASGNALDLGSGTTAQGAPAGAITRQLANGLNDGGFGVGVTGTGYFEFGNAVDRFNGASNYSLEGWFKASRSNGTGVLVSNSTTATNTGGGFTLSFTGLFLDCLRDGGGGYAIGIGTAITPNVWIYAVCTVEAVAKQQKLYIDGALTGTGGLGASWTNATGPVRISTPAYPSSFEGLSDIAIYKSALSAEQVKNHFIAAGGSNWPGSTVAPAISGTPNLGSSLSATPGTWTNSPSVTYQWLLNGQEIAGETGPTYVVRDHNGGAQVSVRVVASNASGASYAFSNSIKIASPPANTVAPSVSGTAAVGSVLSATSGTWSGSPEGFTYQWTNNFSPIPGATGPSYTLTAADAGATIEVEVASKNATGGTSYPTSSSNSIEVPPAPVNLSAPTITGVAAVGSALSASSGTWSNNPTSYAYQWTRDGVNISEATGHTYTTTAADAGHAIAVVVSATGAGGTGAPLASAGLAIPTATVAPASPSIAPTLLASSSGPRALALTLEVKLAATIRTAAAVQTALNAALKKCARLKAVKKAACQAAARSKFPLPAVAYTLNTDARLLIAISQSIKGTKSKGGRCLPGGHGKPCRSTLTVLTVAASAGKGPGSVAIGSPKLKPGRYQVVVTATSTRETASVAKQLTVTR